MWVALPLVFAIMQYRARKEGHNGAGECASTGMGELDFGAGLSVCLVRDFFGGKGEEGFFSARGGMNADKKVQFC